MIYLDYAAATPVDEKVLGAMMPYFREQFFNPSAAYLSAKEVRDDLENARHQVAQIIGARSAEIIFTAGATESINIALGGVDGKIAVSAIEHDAVLSFAKNNSSLQNSSNLENQANQFIIPVKSSGLIDLQNIREDISDDVEILSIGYANNEIGTIQKLRDISEIVKEICADRRNRGINRQLLLHTDASQAAGFLDLNVARLGVDLMTLNAAKCYGPKQVGCLYVRAGVQLNSIFRGGGQEMNLRSGTENVAGIIGFAKALQLADKHRFSEVKRLSNLRNDLEKFIEKEFPEALINGAKKSRLPNILNFSLPNLDGERAVFALDMRGVLVATGSACAANKNTQSHVLNAINLAPEFIDGSLRISLGKPTTNNEIEETKKNLAEVLREQLKFGSQK